MRRGARVRTIENARLVDNLLVVGIFVLSVLAVPATPEGQGISVGELTPTIVVFSLISCGALWWRRGRPRTAWAVSLAATLAPLAFGEVGRGLPAALASVIRSSESKPGSRSAAKDVTLRRQLSPNSSAASKSKLRASLLRLLRNHTWSGSHVVRSAVRKTCIRSTISGR